jgi:uncharacterized protein
MGQNREMINKRGSLFAVSVFAVVLTGCSIGGGDTYNGADAGTHGVTVQATGTAKVVPDGVSFTFSISVLAENTEEALSKVAEGSEKARKALEEAGVVSEDFSTQNVSVYPEYTYNTDGSSGSVSGYRGNQAFAVTLRDTTTAGDVVDAVVAAVGNSVQINSVVPILLDTQDAADDAREKAVKAAKAKAESYAELLDEDLGDLQYITEISSPSWEARAIVGSNDLETSAKTEIDLGVQEVSVTVEVRYKFD